MSIVSEVVSAMRDAMPSTSPVYVAIAGRKGSPPESHWYTVVYPDLGVLSSPTLCGDLTTVAITLRLVYVGAVAAGDTYGDVAMGNVQAMCDAARGAILGRSFTDGTWSAMFDPDEHHNTTPVGWDDSVADRTVISATDEFRALASRV